MQRNPGFGKYVIIALIAALGLAVAGGPARADNEGAVKYRESVMKALAGHMGAAVAIIKGEVDLKDELPAHAHAIAAMGKIAKTLFPKGSEVGVGKSAALPAIWEKPDEFAKAVAAFETASATFAGAADSGDMPAIAAAFGALGKSCGGCHQSFRKR